MQLGRDNLNDYLSTDDLILYLNKTEKIVIKEKKKFKINKKHIYGSIVILAVLHLVFMAFPMVFRQASTDLLGYRYAVVFDKNQEFDDRLVGTVIRIEPINPEDIRVGDIVLVYGLYGNEYYWEVEVVDIYPNNNTVDATFDDVIRINYTYDEIEGVAAGEANFIGIFYQTASTPRGFLAMVFLHVLILFGIYYFMFQNKKKDLIGMQYEK